MISLPTRLALFLAAFSPAVSPVHAQLVLSEFVASNVNGLTDDLGKDEDWIEIHNPSASSVSLSGWYLTDDPANLRKWNFPAWTLGPDKRLVVFASDRDLRPAQTLAGSDNAGTYAAPRLAANFKLSNNAGGYLALTKQDLTGGVALVTVIKDYPRQFTNVSCGLSASSASIPTTPFYSNGPGVMRYVLGSASIPSTWNTLAFDDASWTAGSGTSIGFDADYSGATSFKPFFSVDLGSATQLVPSIPPSNPMYNQASTLYARYAFSVTDKSAFSSLFLKIRFEDAFVAYLNGVEITRGNFTGTPAYNSTTTARTETSAIALDAVEVSTPGLPALQNGTNVLAIIGINGSASSNDFLLAPSLEAGLGSSAPVAAYFTPTPGAANSAEKINLGPIVTNVTRNPEPRPLGTSASPPLVITAKVLPSLRPLATSNPVQLKYLVMYGSEVSLNMRDDGVAPDLLAGDSVFIAQIPTNTLGAGQMLRWRVVATDNTAVATNDPEYLNPLDSEQYYGTVANDSTIETALPVLYWFTPSSTAADNTTGTRNSFFYKAVGAIGPGVFYDNVEINLHGQSSAGFPKKSYDLDFNKDNRFIWSASGKPAKDINLLTNWGDKSKTHNQMSHEALATIGSVHHWCHQVRVQQVTPANAATPSSHFFSIADMMEDGDENFMERNGRDPEGALYKIYNALTGTGEKKSRLWETTSTDLQDFANGLVVTNALADRRKYAYDNIDLPQTISYFVGLALVSSQDHGHKNFYVYRDSNLTREWSILPWDVDLTWGRNWLGSSGYFTDTMFIDNDIDLYNTSQQNKGENRLYSLIVGHSDISRLPATEFRDMVLRRLRSTMDSYFSAPGVLEARFTSLADMMDPPAIGTSDIDRDRTKWGTWGSDGGFTAGGETMRYHIQNQLVGTYLTGRRNFLKTATLAGASVPASQPANAGNLITLEYVDFKPSTNNQEHEFFVVRNSNTYAVDLSGWSITGAVRHTFKPGTVLPAGGGVTENLGDLYVAKNPYLFRQRATIPDDNLPGSNQYRYVQGPYEGQLSARGGETIELRDPAGALIRSKSWTAAPTAAQNQLRLTEIHYNAPGPSPEETSAITNVIVADFEFIELTNTGATALNVGGASFTQGVTFTFPAGYTIAPGASVLVVANQAAFTRRHGAGKTIAGTFAGNLSNAGETIELLDPAGEVVLDFTYDDAWFPETDGQGKTLVVSDASAAFAAWDTGTAFWRASKQNGGSPGTSAYNAAPAFASATISLSATAGTAFTGQLSATDTDLGDVLSFTKQTGPTWLAVSPAGSLTGSPTAGDAGANVFSIAVTDGIATATATLTVTVTVPAGPSLGQFSTTHFNETERANPAISGPNADPDGDGLPNLLEYALGSDPRTTATATQPLPTLASISDQTHAALTFRRIKGATDLTFVLEVSATPDNAGFAPAPATLTVVTDHGDGTETVTLRETVPLAPATASSFVRLRIVQN